MQPRVVVIGAGAFGGWTALELRRRGAKVTLIDAWGPGNARASSGGETRVIRSTYGSRAHYTSLTIRARQRWQEFERQIQRHLFHRTGVLWLFDASAQARAFVLASLDALRDQREEIHELTVANAGCRYPQIDFAGVSRVMFEPDAGYLMSRCACAHVVERFQLEGGVYRLGAASIPADPEALRAERLALSDQTSLDADLFVFACGPWLGRLFPDVVGRRVIATRQEVYYFGPPAADPRFTEVDLPVWIDFADNQIYGIPGNGHRGFKVADDLPGPEMDPTADNRDASAGGVTAARTFLARRFPAVASAPLVGSEVCQYEASPDSELIIDRHPRAGNVWMIGGGSGHGFKMGPAVGELVASLLFDDVSVDPRFALARFDVTPPEQLQAKWT